MRGLSKERPKRYAVQILTLGYTLAELPAYHGAVSRHVKVPTSVVDSYRVEAEVIEKGFLSTSSQAPIDFSASLYKVLLELRSNGGGRSIQGMKTYNEDEVLFPPGRRFMVVSRRARSQISAHDKKR